MRKNHLPPSGNRSHRRRLTFTFVTVAIAVSLITHRISYAMEAPSGESDQNFILLKGSVAPVCKAYRELLNQTKFEQTPFCGRPLEGPVIGFEHLEGHYMVLEEIWPLFTGVWEFMRFGDQHHVEKFIYPNVDTKKSYTSTDATSREEIAQSLKRGWMYVWAYAAPVDLNNDGSPLNVITWQGYGATGTGSQCGSDYAFRPWTDSYIAQRAFVLTTDGKAIDEAQTRLIFGAPAGVAQTSGDPQVPGPGLPPGGKPFRPMADSIGIFKFEGRYYIETEDRPVSKDAELPPVRVFLREHGSTKQVCALHPQSVPVPLD